MLIILFLSLVTFLYLNHKSKIFLGDSGSHLLGFVISYLIIFSAKQTDYLILSADKIFLMILPGLELIRLFILELSKKDIRFPLIETIFCILLKHYNETKTLLILVLLSGLPILIAVNFEKHLHIFIILLQLYFLIIKKFNSYENKILITGGAGLLVVI